MFNRTPVHEIPDTPLTARCSSTQAGQLCREAGFVNEHQLCRIEIELAVEPVSATLQDVGAVLLQCMCGLFLNVQPRRQSQALKALRLIRTDCSPTSRSTISFNVMSLRSSISPTMKTSCPSRLELRRRRCGRGASSPILARNPADRARYTDPEPCCRLPRQHAFIRCPHDPRPKIAAQCLAHSPPPCRSMLNQNGLQQSPHNRFIDHRTRSRCRPLYRTLIVTQRHVPNRELPFHLTF
ncbi:hypothetical protein C8J38_1311 [Rhizobium sp. PP-WC-2G-219]|nr:hypothetical protein C8J38_1311 [Rhizobium sp. PP-WC-2G-219]